MKRIYLVLLVLSILNNACGTKGGSSSATANPVAPGPCAGVQTGTWNDIGHPSSDVLRLNDQCTGSTTYCHETFTYSIAANGDALLFVTATDGGPECLTLGLHTCGATWLANQSNNQLQTACGVGKNISTIYQRQGTTAI